MSRSLYIVFFIFVQGQPYYLGRRFGNGQKTLLRQPVQRVLVVSGRQHQIELPAPPFGGVLLPFNSRVRDRFAFDVDVSKTIVRT